MRNEAPALRDARRRYVELLRRIYRDQRPLTADDQAALTAARRTVRCLMWGSYDH